MPTVIRLWEAFRAPQKWRNDSRIIGLIGMVLMDASGGAQRTVRENLLDMERFKYQAREEDMGAVALALDLTKAFERVSLPVVWAWATHFSFPRKILRVLCGYFEHQRRVQFEGCVAEPLQTVVAVLPGSKWSCLLQRIVLQDALSEVTQNYPPLRLRFVDDVTALLMGRNQDLVEKTGKVMRKLIEEVEEKGLKLSITENGKEGKSKMIASCGYLEEEIRECSKEERVTMADSVETLGVDVRTKIQRLGVKEKARRKECNVRFSHITKNKAFQKSYMKVRVRKLLRTGLVLARAWRAQAVGIAPTERLKLRRQMGAAAGKKESASLSLFLEVYGLEVEEELSTMATHSWAEGVWIGKWPSEQKEAWRKQIFDGSEVETSERTCRSCHVRLVNSASSGHNDTP